MPTYEYVCRKCGHEFEQFQRITDPPLKRCPKCRGAVRRKIGSGASLLFKGSGFYATDYRSESYKKAASADSAAGKASATPASKTGSAPADKKAKTGSTPG